jgi:hypothetical protein
MGASFNSILIRTNDAGVVQGAVKAVRNLKACKFWMGPPIRGWISLFPDPNGRHEDVIAALAKRLQLDVFYLTVYDDDYFAYDFYRGGSLVDGYNSWPDYFEDDPEEAEPSLGNPALFQHLLTNPKDLEK